MQCSDVSNRTQVLEATKPSINIHQIGDCPCLHVTRSGEATACGGRGEVTSRCLAVVSVERRVSWTVVRRIRKEQHQINVARVPEPTLLSNPAVPRVVLKWLRALGKGSSSQLWHELWYK